MTRPKFKRKWYNLLVNPPFQLKVMFYFWVSGLAGMGLFTYLIFSKIELIRMEAIQADVVDFKLLEVLNQVIQDISFIIPVTLAIFTVIAFLYTVIITHRMAGPLVAIQAYIKDLINGNYDSQRSLRKYDEFKVVMDSLKELAEALKSRELSKDKLSDKS